MLKVLVPQIVTSTIQMKMKGRVGVRVISNRTKIDALVDSGSQANLISKELVKELRIETIPHHKPYPLGWIVKDANVQVSRKCIFRFAMTANFFDEVELDVVPLDISGIILGIPYW